MDANARTPTHATTHTRRQRVAYERRRESMKHRPTRRFVVSGLHISEAVLRVSGEDTVPVPPPPVLLNVPHLHCLRLTVNHDLLQSLEFVQFDPTRVAHSLRVVVEPELREGGGARRARREVRVPAIAAVMLTRGEGECDP